jgi:2-dehydro-3-deoxyphosphogluconate aldolase / (4S)-4-hydroxy-2-oxoglutarate aldolase
MIPELLKRRVIPVIVIDDANKAEPLAEALLKGGMDIIEVTCRTAAAPEALRRLRTSFPDMLVGAGTVVTPEQAALCIDLGVQFGLAPGLNPDTVNRFRENGIPFIPGVMTPSEIERGLALGCRLLKYFPAGACGGPAALKSVAAPYASLGVKFCPTGGIGLDNMADYLALPVVASVGGSWIASRNQIANGDWAAITDNAHAALDRAGQARDGAGQRI